MEYRPSEKIDLHVHSSASDGTLSPSEILIRAQELNLKAIAITDHDTVSGSRAALRLGIPPTLKFLTGVEISASPPPGFTVFGSFHILGYAIHLEHPVLNATLKDSRKPEKTETLKFSNGSVSWGLISRWRSFMPASRTARSGGRISLS